MPASRPMSSIVFPRMAMSSVQPASRQKPYSAPMEIAFILIRRNVLRSITPCDAMILSPRARWSSKTQSRMAKPGALLAGRSRKSPGSACSGSSRLRRKIEPPSPRGHTRRMASRCSAVRCPVGENPASLAVPSTSKFPARNRRTTAPCGITVASRSGE